MKKRIVRSGALLIWAFAGPALFAQSLQIRAYGTSDGLPQSEVVSIYQDHAGYLWFGTYENGLVRYDGRSFQRPSAPNNILAGAVHEIYQDRRGTLWIGTEEGLVRLAKHPENGDTTVTVFTQADGLPDNYVTSILEDNRGVLWVGTNEGACCLTDSRFVAKRTKRSAGNNYIFAMTLAPDGSVWMGTADGVNIWRGDSVQTLTTADGLSNNRIRAILCDRDGAIWIGTSSGLSQAKNNVVQTYNEKNGLHDIDIFALAQDQQGYLWIGSRSGLSKFDPTLASNASVKNKATSKGVSQNQLFRHFDRRHGLSVDRIAALFVDYENNLWIGTWGGGVCKLFGTYLENYLPRNGLPAAPVYSLFEDDHGRMWIGTNGGGLAIVEGDHLIIRDTRHGLPNNVVHAFGREPAGAIWVGTHAGAVRIPSDELIFAPKQWQIFTTANGLTDDRINDLYCAPNGEVWLATGRAGALCYTGGKFTTMTVEHGLPSNTVNAIHRDRQGRLWIATIAGLLLRHDGKQKIFFRRDGLPDENVYCIFETHDGNLWFGTRRGGAARYGDGKFSVLNTANGLSDNVVYFITEDRRQRLWFGTNAGIDCFEAVSLNEFLDRHGPTEPNLQQENAASEKSHDKVMPFFHLSAVHGLADNECNTRAALCDRNGHLWFGTAGGAARLYPEFLPLATPPPRAHIQSIAIGGRQHPPLGNLQFPTRATTSLIVHFRTLSFINENYTSSQYFLEGFDRDWIGPTNEDQARYTNLPPGAYVFHLRGLNANGVSSTETASVRFEILPPFYRTWWFIISSLVLAAGLIYSGYRWRIRQVHRRNIELEKLIEEKTHNLQDAHAFLSNIKDSMPIGLLVFDNKRFVVEANRTSTELFGYSLNDLLGQEIHNLLASDKLTRDMLWAALREDMRTSASPSNGRPTSMITQTGIELDGLKHDGKKFPCLVHACCVGNERGELRYVILTCEDITEWRQLEQKLIENQKQLALVDLMAGMGDILNNKLVGIHGYLDLLKTALTVGVARREDSGENTPVNPVEVVNWAQTSANEMSTILRQLIEFGTYLAKVPVAPLDLRDMLHALQRRWSKILKVQLPEMPEPIPVMVIPKIKAGLDEAIRNSREANATEVLIHVETLVEQSRVRLTLTDNGRGISPELVTKVFLPFFKTKATTHPGLGLWKLRQLVQQSGGTVEINFVPKGGTQLVVILPMATREQLSEQATGPIPAMAEEIA
ncbi:MAG: PAS domain-containing protein [candidate division KSB1 bacterium]|nr:PAS domain-containing protein [candidate division KSB1 bacterium]MDZ7303182.1 PAS domain-containing protein [candidate division KSB1 bacterium]MDZ7310161.1 PAS domain-containing protein [candidate division KSB1 bacterium]